MIEESDLELLLFELLGDLEVDRFGVEWILKKPESYGRFSKGILPVSKK